MKLARRRALPALIGLAMTAGAVSIASPAHADDPENTAPTASYALDSTAIWAGQTVTLTESGLTDDTTAPEAIKRTVAWGDGTTDATALTHAYAANGTYQITVTLNDGTLDGAGTFTTGSAVAVTTSPGTFAWQKSPVYTYPGYMEQATLLGSGLPTSARVWSAWGDGETSLLAGGTSATVGHWFGKGDYTPKTTLQNGQGKATSRDVTTLNVLEDITPPTVSLTIPASPNKAASWATVKGKAGDSEAGIDVAGVVLFKYTSTNFYYYNFTTKAWVLDNSDDDLPDAALALRTPDASGNWSVPVSGLSKGYTLEVWYDAWDKVGNVADEDGYYVQYALTS